MVARIFKLKLSASMQDIVKSELFGKFVAYVKVIEFQKRRLLQSHTLFIRGWGGGGGGGGGDVKPFTTEDIDLLVCAEISQDKISRELVARHMMPCPCGLANPNSPCMKDEHCNKKIHKSFNQQTQRKRSLKHFELPQPALNELLPAEEEFNRIKQREISINRQVQMNMEQRNAFTSVMAVIHSPNLSSIDNVFFIDGPGGAGKTFPYNTLLAEVRGKGLTAIPVAYFGIAADLLCGGATAHSTFQIPIPIEDHSTCNIS